MDDWGGGWGGGFGKPFSFDHKLNHPRFLFVEKCLSIE